MTLYACVTVICASQSVYDCNVCFVKACRSNVKLFWLVSYLDTCVSAVSLSQVSNIFTMSQSHVSIPLSWPMSLSQKKCLDSTTAYVMESHIIQQNLRHCEHWLRHPYTDMIVFCTKFCISYVIQRHLLVTTCFIHCMLLNHCVMTVFSLKKRMNE